MLQNLLVFKHVAKPSYSLVFHQVIVMCAVWVLHEFFGHDHHLFEDFSHHFNNWLLVIFFNLYNSLFLYFFCSIFRILYLRLLIIELVATFLALALAQWMYLLQLQRWQLQWCSMRWYLILWWAHIDMYVAIRWLWILSWAHIAINAVQGFETSYIWMRLLL